MRFAAFGIALWTICCGAASALSADASPDARENEFFERKIRPLLAQHCFACHGGDKKKGGLSLDSREGLLAGGESGTVAIPGKPEESLLIEAVGYDGDLQMPPSGKLARDEIEALKQWLAMGVPWPATNGGSGGSIRAGGAISDADRQFWSFQPIRDHAPPTVQRTDWPRRTIDYFVLHRLESEGLEPVEEAGQATFIRRATFDLLGLPPTADEVEAFVSDVTPDAYERLIDRLLASPHYGERWARHWLDVARYGEDQAHTFAARMYPSGYRYRDWVVEALVRDMPMDRFMIEQIAGDLLDEEDPARRLPALGFFALGPVYYADAGCGAKAKMDEYDDRVDTLCRGLLGLTVACARCHDHKFDPITTRDYYALAGVFSSSDYFEAPLAPPDVVQRYDDEQARIKQAEQRQKDAQADETRKLGESLAPQAAPYLVAAWKVQHRRRVEPGYKLAEAAKALELHEFLLDRWLQHLAADASAKQPLLAPWRELVARQDAKRDLSDEPAAVAEVESVAAAIQKTIVEAVTKRQAIDAEYAQQVAALKESEKKPNKPALDKDAAAILKQIVDDKSAPLALPKPQADKLLPAERRQFLTGLQQEVDGLKKSAAPKYPVAHSLKEGKVGNLKIHIRGSHTELGDEVPRRFIEVLSTADAKPFQQGSGRLELARAIASPANPLTARVLVNRVWQHHFGRGIVGTPSNFGMLGERPTHPELLDHLASRFIASGWSLKQLHREIMLSATYRLASTRVARNDEHDPDNRLLWRMNRRRLDVESRRDAVLAACGNLDLAIGGPSLNLNDGNRRRTLYAAVSRHDLNPMLRLFDFPDPNLTSERRTITTVPMQQLFVLNSEFVIRQAKALAARAMNEQLPDDEARLDRTFRWVLGRAPQDQERQLAREFLAGGTSAGSESPGVKLSQWEQLAQILLGTNEFTFVD